MLPTHLPDLTLRELAPDDAMALHALLQANRSHLTAHGDYGDQVGASLEMLAAELADNTDGKRRFGIFLGTELVGRADLTPVDPPRFGLGYWLAQNATGKGYAQAALTALLSFAASELGATEIYAGVTHGNERSTALLQRLGFAPIASFERYARFRLLL